MLIDTHSHLNFRAYKNDTDEVIRRSLNNGIWIINVGTNIETSKRTVGITQKYKEGVFASVGLHPISLDTGLVRTKDDNKEGSHFEKEFKYKAYKKLAQAEKVVAIGEVGLDYYFKPKTRRKLELFKERQRTLLLKEIELAREVNLPVIFHCRMAHNDLIQILSNNPKNRPSKAVTHGFVGILEQLQAYLSLGFSIGFNGIIFKKIEGINFEENIKNTPLERILVETDCPYLTPPPFQEERNEPLYLRYIVQKIAQVKKITSEEVVEVTTRNARELFKI